MTSGVAQISIVLVLLGAIPLHAQQPRSAEEWAEVREGEIAHLDLQTIRKFGESQGRFDVLITWADSVRPPPQDYLPRTVRYAANCEEGTMVLVAVGIYDRNGQVAKTLVVPPGAADAVKPQKPSDQAKWVQRTCMF